MLPKNNTKSPQNKNKTPKSDGKSIKNKNDDLTQSDISTKIAASFMKKIE